MNPFSEYHLVQDAPIDAGNCSKWMDSTVILTFH